MDMFQMDLLPEQLGDQPSQQEIVKDAYLIKGFALPGQAALLADLQYIIAVAPLRHMETPGGFIMSVAMTNCGALGWVTDRQGYRYTAHDPLSGQPWPVMPDSFMQLARRAAIATGFNDFVPDVCLINQYKIGARMTLHQDKDELDFSQPIVSVSLGIPAVFQLGGLSRSDKPVRLTLAHGDVVVWGGESRLRFHGVMPLKANHHPATGDYRINLTFRKAG